MAAITSGVAPDVTSMGMDALGTPENGTAQASSSNRTMPKAYTSESFDECAKLITSGASQQAVPTPWVMLLAPVSATARADPQSPILATK